MKTLFVIEHGARKATVLARDESDVNRMSICCNGIRGYINRSGAILCRSIETKKILANKEKISILMRKIFPDDFKELYSAVLTDINNPVKQSKRDSYYKH